MKRNTLFLLWLGASISISEIFTGGLLAPLGLGKGLAVIFFGHLIGVGLLAFGGYIAYANNENAMSCVARALGPRGGALVAFCNVLQLIGWTLIMIVQAGSALTSVMPSLPFAFTAFMLSLLVLGWALLLGSPGGRLNDIAVVLLMGMCLIIFFRSFSSVSLTNSQTQAISLALAMELSITMPVSWLPLIGDYSCRAKDKTGAVVMPFAGYFVGSIFMYSLGLLISLSTGKDIFQFIASSEFRIPACAVILLSTLTTAFLDLYSAAVSSQKLVHFKKVSTPVVIIGLLAVVLTTFFPVERYSGFLISFLTTIGLVFVPVYTVVFLSFLKIGGSELKSGNMAVAVFGMFGYYFFSRFELGIPTLSTVVLVCIVYTARVYLCDRKRVEAAD